MLVNDIISQVRDRKPTRRNLDRLKGIMWHRVGVDKRSGIVLGSTGLEIANCFLGNNPKFLEVANATGKQNPYTFYIRTDGTIDQALPIEEIGYHARRHSAGYIGIAAIGDFRTEHPTPEQWRAAVELGACLSDAYCIADHVGHGEIKGAHGGGKAEGRKYACPGDLWDMPHFRSNVAELKRLNARDKLSSAGVVFDLPVPPEKI